MDKLVLYEVKDRVGYITLNRPEKRNALSFEFVQQIKRVFTQAESDENCKVIVVKANGDAFCSGADLASLKAMQNNTYDENLADSKNLKSLFAMIYQSRKIVIAQVQGAAIAGGCGLASICDFCFATPESKFSYSEVKIGFVPAIVMVFLIRKVGEQIAKKLLLTAELFDATQAKNYQLINEVIEANEIENHVFNFAQKLCKGTSGQSLALTKQMIDEVQNRSLIDALNYASEMNAYARQTSDCKRGINAFLNKEKLVW
ncbi:MAG: enoyl-CoA hydratase/isomerase family protein [Bacteroidia bacterium]